MRLCHGSSTADVTVALEAAVLVVLATGDGDGEGSGVAASSTIGSAAGDGDGSGKLPSYVYDDEPVYEYVPVLYDASSAEVPCPGMKPPVVSAGMTAAPAAAPVARYWTSYMLTLMGKCRSPSLHMAASQNGGHGAPQSKGQLSGSSGPPTSADEQ